MKKRYVILFFLILFGIIAFLVVNNAPVVVETPAPEQTEQGGSSLTPEPAPVVTNGLIEVATPVAGARVTSPIKVTGQARGNWFFEGSFPLVLTDWDGTIIAQGYATADGEWMTTDFVPFEGTLSFKLPPNMTNNRGFLILKKDNPSGEARFDDSIELPVTF